MIRQAAPPARRRLLLVVALLVAPWVGQGVAGAYSMSVNPQSGPAGLKNVQVILSGFGAGCIVTFDGEPVAGVQGCEGETTLVFDVPSSASVGNHEIEASEVGIDGIVPKQSMVFRVTAPPATTAPPVTSPPISSPPVSTSVADVQVGPVGSPTVPGAAATQPGAATTTAPSTVAGETTTTVATAQPAGTTSTSGPVFAITCPPRQVALMRFAASPTRGRPGAEITGTTSWGQVGSCTEIRALRVLLDGMTAPGSPPEAGTSGTFTFDVPRDADPGRHTLALVADDDPSFVLASLGFVVEEAPPSLVPIVGLMAAGAALVVVVFLLLRRRRRRKRDRAADEWESSEAGWGGPVEVPDIARDTAVTQVDAPPVVVVEDQPTMPVVPLVVSSGRDGSFYLLERQNPHAPRQANGRRGWYRDRRAQPVRGILADTVEPHTAGAAASELATSEVPASAHVVVDVDGVLDLLPDDIVAVHRPDIDDGILVMLLAGVGHDPVTDEIVLGHAGAWAMAKMGEHRIPPRLVTADELARGQAGLLFGATTFLWHRMVTLDNPPPPPSGEADEATATATAPEPEPEPDPVPDPAAIAERLVEAAMAGLPAMPAMPAMPETPPEPTRPAVSAFGDVSAASIAPPPPTPTPPPPPPPRERRPLPSPDELIAQVMAEPSYYLVEHENPHATLRANGKHGWYYPTRYGGIRAVVLHSLPGGDTADTIAAHLAVVDQPEAAHAVVDPDVILDLLPDDATALHGVRSSSAAIDLALAYPPSRWGTDPAVEEALLVRAATWAGVRAVRHRIPVRRITVEQWHSGQGGFAGSGDVDPGPDFPWDRFLQLTAWVAGRVAAGAMSSH